MKMKRIEGISASPGIALGPAFLYLPSEPAFEQKKPIDPALEWERLQAALQTATDQLVQLQEEMEAKASADILKAQTMMLADPELERLLHAAIVQNGESAELAMENGAEHFANQLESLQNELLKARAADVRDVKGRVLRILLNIKTTELAELAIPSIILARDLAPSDTASLQPEMALALCTAEGGPTSHSAILARSLGIPAVVGAGGEILRIESASPLALDGGAGELIVHPNDSEVARLEAKKARLESDRATAQKQASKPAITKDDQWIAIMANVGNLADAQSAKQLGAEGIGLLRTEFLFLGRREMPSEDEQFQAYMEILKVFDDQPVILRTLDIGGDKPIPYLKMPKESNPFLGLRGARLALTRPELLRTQIRAALRASADHELRMMFPFVSDLRDVHALMQEVQHCKSQLESEGFDFDNSVEVGIMVEIPSAALLAGKLAQEVDFFSIGTNDLSQYTLAADRTNAAVAPLANSLHPAVLRLIQMVAEAAHSHGKWVGVCGELAGGLLAIPILLGLGIDELSMSGDRIAPAKQLIRELDSQQIRHLAQEALELASPDEIESLIRSRLTIPEL
jgi:phosphoenolpyruvate-protein phosphotransferase